MYRIHVNDVPCPNCILYHAYEINLNLITCERGLTLTHEHAAAATNTSSSQKHARVHQTRALLMAVPLLPLTHQYSRGVGDIA